MRAKKYIEELIEFEESYQGGYGNIKDIPADSVRRLKDLKAAKKELNEKYNSNLLDRVYKGLDKEYHRQKKAGKKFIPDSEIDRIIDDVIKKELGDNWKENYT